ncbi:transmembrane protein 184C-like isoform X2 [Rhagoletis pomonella]|uniref:transmembrane protein 184C-like isoform X2 n=1 Tax=Rhagoletis pomonella TaxID=28610 RepID=UPI0017806CAC|nr:transmembrane protein 184C-like isoform X2 [Rhagoletis pomonella]
MYSYEKLNPTKSSRRHNLIVPKYTYLASSRLFFINAVRLWNNIPESVKSILNRSNYKAIILNYFKSMYICELCGVYGEGTFAGNVAFPYIIVINNISQFVAMYCLVLFYKANKEDLKPMKPIPKFLCIKAVVFFSFFQGVILFLLAYYNVLQPFFSLGDDTNLASMLQNFLICIEMFIAAVAHIYSFPHYPFHINSPQYWNNPNHNWCRAFLSMMDISDMQQDVTEHLGVVSSSISRHFQGRSNYQPLPRGTRRSSSETEYLMSKRQDGNSNSERMVTGMPTASTTVGDVIVVSGNSSAVGQSAGIRSGHHNTSAKTSFAVNTAAAAGTHSNFGINIQKREVHAREYSPHQLYGGPVPVGNSFLQARNVVPHSSSILDTDDDFVSLMGADR